MSECPRTAPPGRVPSTPSPATTWPAVSTHHPPLSHTHTFKQNTDIAPTSGYDGRDPVPFVCPASSGAKLTFEFRLWPNYEQPGALDPGHKGPCAVYVKRVDDMFADAAAGDGWLKIWDDGYDNKTQEWCTDRLIAHDGLLSVDLPTGLAPGYYLVRPEILALHFAYKGDPQFYLGCAQIFIQGGPAGATVPKDKMVSIPGYVDADTPGLGFDIYKDVLPAYPMPGPAVYAPTASDTSKASSLKQQVDLSKGAVPQSCLLKNANWCAQEVPRYTDQDGCWAAVKNCYAQSKRCWDSAPASGSANCYTWSDYCTVMNDACERQEFDGPAAFKGKEKFVATPGDIPEPWNKKAPEETSSKVSDGPEPTTVRTEVRSGGSSSSKTADSPETSKTTTETPSKTAADSSKSTQATKTTEAGGASSGLPRQTSTHGKCGPEFGQTCSGSAFGDCCSKNGECGRKARHCACGCVAGYGSCWE